MKIVLGWDQNWGTKPQKAHRNPRFWSLKLKATTLNFVLADINTGWTRCHAVNKPQRGVPAAQGRCCPHRQVRSAVTGIRALHSDIAFLGSPRRHPRQRWSPARSNVGKKSLKNIRFKKFSETRRECGAFSAAQTVHNYNNDFQGFIWLAGLPSKGALFKALSSPARRWGRQAALQHLPRPEGCRTPTEKFQLSPTATAVRPQRCLSPPAAAAPRQLRSREAAEGTGAALQASSRPFPLPQQRQTDRPQPRSGRYRPRSAGKRKISTPPARLLSPHRGSVTSAGPRLCASVHPSSPAAGAPAPPRRAGGRGKGRRTIWQEGTPGLRPPRPPARRGSLSGSQRVLARRPSPVALRPRLRPGDGEWHCPSPSPGFKLGRGAAALHCCHWPNSPLLGRGSTCSAGRATPLVPGQASSGQRLPPKGRGRAGSGVRRWDSAMPDAQLRRWGNKMRCTWEPRGKKQPRNNKQQKDPFWVRFWEISTVFGAERQQMVAEEMDLAPSTGRKWPWLKKAARNANLILAKVDLSFCLSFFSLPFFFWFFWSFCNCSALQLRSSLSWFPTQSYWCLGFGAGLHLRGSDQLFEVTEALADSCALYAKCLCFNYIFNYSYNSEVV